MAKRDLRDDGTYTSEALGRYCSSIRINNIMNSFKEPLPRTMGIRQKTLEIYHSQGIVEAYNFLKEYNKRFDKPIYTKEMFKRWIMEEYEKMRKYVIDNGNER